MIIINSDVTLEYFRGIYASSVSFSVIRGNPNYRETLS